MYWWMNCCQQASLEDERVSNTLKQALLLWGMLLVLALWLGFNQASTAMKFGVTVALIVIAVGLLACWRGKKTD